MYSLTPDNEVSVQGAGGLTALHGMGHFDSLLAELLKSKSPRPPLLNTLPLHQYCLDKEKP